jgi:glycosyltransferase involved in cell wall biosynthesis
LKVLSKNLAVVPKALFVADSLKQNEVAHIHAHWGSTTSTMAWIISELTGIPWSLTLHRWDIAEDNMLRLKVDRAAFARCISESGRREVLAIAGDKYQGKVKLLHVGVRCIDQAATRSRESSSKFTIACPANLLPVKGHRFLIEACSLLRKQGTKDFECLLIGDGPLESELHRQVAKSGLQGTVRIIGALPHERLMALYERGEVNAVVLPSIVTAKGEKEGIPVALMEAMSFGIPVVSTNTGGIPELLSDGAGITVEEKNPGQLADVLEKLIDDAGWTERLIEKGRRRIEEEFNLVGNARTLLRMMQHTAADPAGEEGRR